MRCAIPLLGAAFAGCMSIPLSTMVRFATFGPEDLLSIDASQVRMRISSDSDAPLILQKTRLKMEMVVDDRRATMPGAVLLESEQDLHPDTSAWSFSKPIERIYVVRLDDDAVASFRQLQERIRRRQPGYLVVGADYDFEGKEKARVTVELKLSATEDYFTLLERAAFPPENLEP